MKRTILTITKKFITHELIRGSMFIFSGGLLASFFNFLFNLFLTHNLSYGDYGTYAALVSLMGLASIPSQSLSPVFVRFSGEFIAKKQYNLAALFYKKALLWSSLIAFLLFISFLIFTIPLTSFLHITNNMYIVSIATIIAITYIYNTNSAFLQGLLHFSFLSFITFFQTILKVILGIGLVLLGMKLFGVLLAIFLATIVVIVTSFFPLHTLWHSKNTLLEKTILHKQIVFYTISIFFVTFAQSSFTASDVLLVKHFFSASTAGVYAGLALVGKIVFYFTSPIITVMFPLLVKRVHKGENVLSLLYLSFLVIAIPSGAITLIYFLLPSLILHIVLGGKLYESASSYLGWYGIYIMLYSLCNIFINFFMSVNKVMSGYIAFTFALLQIMLIVLFHQSIGEILIVSTTTLLVLFILLLLYYVRTYVKSK